MKSVLQQSIQRKRERVKEIDLMFCGLIVMQNGKLILTTERNILEREIAEDVKLWTEDREQKRQKELLVDGDYFEGGTVEQYRGLLEIEGMNDIDLGVRISIRFGLVSYNADFNFINGLDRANKLDFETFRRKAINTFKAK